MLHFLKSIFLFLILGFTVMAFAQSGGIDPERVEVYVKELIQQSEKDLSENEINQYRKILTERLQKAEILKNEALALGLDKKTDIQLQLKNSQALFYAEQYLDYLNKNIVIDEDSLKEFYLSTQRDIKLQVAGFATQKEANEAQKKLRKGMGFKTLLNSLKNQTAISDDFISLSELPDSIAAVAIEMEKGQISNKPVEFQDAFYLLKIVDVRLPSDIQAFEEQDDQVKANIIAWKKRQQVLDKINALYEKHGLTQ